MDSVYNNSPGYLLTMAKNASEKERAGLIQSIGAIVSTLPKNSNNQDQAVDILIALIKEATIDIRKKMSEMVAKDEQAPQKLAYFLASSDEIEVSKPVLQYSLSLNDTDLIELIKDRSSEYVEAVAARQKVSKELAMIIVQTEYPQALETLLNNNGAQLDDKAIDTLAKISKKISNLQEPLLMRPEMSQKLATEIYWFAGQQVREIIMNKFHVKAAMVDKTIKDSIDISLNEKNNFVSQRDAMLYAKMLEKQGKLNSQSYIRVLREKNVHLFNAMIATKTDLPIECINIIVKNGNPNFLATICQGANIGKVDFATIYLLTRPYIIGYKKSATNPNDLRNVMRSYEELKNSGYASENISKWRNSPQMVSLLLEQLSI